MDRAAGISDLNEEGILYRRHGVGTFGRQPPKVVPDHTGLTNFFEGQDLRYRSQHARPDCRYLASAAESSEISGLIEAS